MTAEPDPTPRARTVPVGHVGEIFAAFLRLGLTSFGGLVASGKPRSRDRGDLPVLRHPDRPAARCGRAAESRAALV